MLGRPKWTYPHHPRQGDTLSCKPDGSFCNTTCKPCEKRMLSSARLAHKRELARMAVLQGTNRRYI
jgi:hypothetical protein